MEGLNRRDKENTMERELLQLKSSPSEGMEGKKRKENSERDRTRSRLLCIEER